MPDLDEIREETDRSNRSLLRNTEALQKRILKEYNLTQRRVATRARDLLTKLPKNAPPSAILSTLNSNSFTAFLAREIKRLNTLIRSILQAAAPAVAALLTKILSREFRALDLSHRPQVPVDHVREILAPAIANIERWNNLLPRDLSSQLGPAIRLGATPNQVARSMLLLKGKQPETGQSTAFAKARARMLPNTRYAAIYAANSARQRAFAEAAQRDGIQLQKMWISMYDSCCASCAHLHGQIASLDEPFEWENLAIRLRPYNGILHHPPLHPNCRCKIIPYAPDLVDDDLLYRIRSERAQAIRRAS